MSLSKQHQIMLEPIISYPHEAQVGKTYLMTIDLRIHTTSAEWPFDEEEYPISFVLDTMPLFSYEPIGENDPTVVLHRFGGTYGAATYLLTAAQQEIRGTFQITLVNDRGVPIEQITLKSKVSTREISDQEVAEKHHEVSIPTYTAKPMNPIKTVSLQPLLPYEPLSSEERKRAARASISDEALRLEIMQRLNQGSQVVAGDFPDVDVTRIRNAMAALEKELASAALVYDAAAMKIAYRNAEGVRRIYDICSRGSMNPTLAAMLVQTFLKELGLPEASVDTQSKDTYFFVAQAQADVLTSMLPTTFPVFVPMLSEQEIRERNIHSIFQKRFNDENPENRFAVILSASSSTLLRVLLTQPDEGGIRENIVYLNEEDMRSIITSKAPDIKTTFMKLVRTNVRLTTIAPFITAGPTKGIMFVGREREINSVLQNIESRSYAIPGGRRIGKTSILYQIKLRLQRQGYRVLDLDCSAVSSYHEFYRTILADWAEELGTYAPLDDLAVTFREMVAVLSKSNPSKAPLVFVFDEIDRLLDFDIQQQNPEQLFRTFRDLSQHQRCQFIFSGERRIYRQLRDSSSPLFNFCTAIKLDLLSQDDARKLIEEPFERLDIPLDGGRALTDSIIDACSYHPNLIQKMCLELLTLLDQSGDTLYPKITQELVTRVMSQPQFEMHYMDIFWGQSTSLERAITLLVHSSEPVEPASITTRLQQRGFKINQEQLDTALEYLTLYCVFRHDSNGVKWAATHFDEIADKVITDREEYIADLRDRFLMNVERQ